MYLDHSTYAQPPSRFEPGTPAIAEAIGLGAAVDYLQDIGMQKVQEFEQDLGGYLYEKVRTLLLALPGVSLNYLHPQPDADQVFPRSSRLLTMPGYCFSLCLWDSI